MKQKIELKYYLGTERDMNNNLLPLDDQRTKEALQIICARFGGYTLSFTRGGWNGPNGLVEERGMLITILTDQDTYNRCAAITGDMLRIMFRQSSVISTHAVVGYEEFNCVAPQVRNETFIDAVEELKESLQ